MTQQKIKGDIFWQEIEALHNTYLTSHSVNRFNTSNDRLESFIFPMQSVDAIIAVGAKELYFAFGYHPSTNDQIEHKGITAIMFGINSENEAVIDQNAPMWDAHKRPDPENNLVKNTNGTDLLNQIKEYRNTANNKFETEASFDDDGDGELDRIEKYILKGLRIDMAEIELFQTRVRRPDELECILGWHTDFSQKNHSQRGHTFGILGRKEGSRLTQTGTDRYATDPSIDKAFDYCDPCPRVCPNFINF
ncbi:MAG: hypothetical protein ACFHU9_02350 [Fluviicola sp.]